MAYGVSLGYNGQPEEGLDLLRKAGQLLDASSAHYAEMQLLHQYASCLLQTQAGFYWKAQSSINRLITLQEDSEDYNPKRLAGMYNLAGYLHVVNQGSPTTHHGLAAHKHVQPYDLERSLPYFRAALSIDSSRTDSKANLQLVSDSLGLPIYPIQPDPRRAGSRRRLTTATTAYPHLPYGAANLLDFADYDELLFLVDISGSMVMEQVSCMSADRFTVMREAAEFLLDYLPSDTQAGLATIGGDCGSEPSWWIPVDSIDRNRLRFEIQYLNPDGTTPLLTTLVEAPVLFTDRPNRRRAIFFISDGENVCSLPGVDICDWATGLQEDNIEINVLTFLDQGLQNSGAFAEYACLTDRTGGEVRYFNPDVCAIDYFRFDLLDRISFELPALEKVNCWGSAFEQMWAIYPED
ncbi:MAG: vWA domain-containing protein [Bacteroidota bacterium]